MLSTDEIMVSESKFNIFQVKYSHYEASLKKVKVPVVDVLSTCKHFFHDYWSTRRDSLLDLQCVHSCSTHIQLMLGFRLLHHCGLFPFMSKLDHSDVLQGRIHLYKQWWR
jgi:hypothetical protein